MITSTIIFLLPLVALTTACPFLPCNCGLGPGEDVCSDHPNKKCTPLVVRPVEVPKPLILPPISAPLPPKILPIPPPLIPMAGPCGCKQAIVKPAVVPKPPCLSCGGCLSNNAQLTLNQQQQILFGGGVPAPLPNPTPVIVDSDPLSPASPGNPANYVPADPVSVHLAYKMAQESACNLNEDKLSFGFRTLPKDIPLYLKKAAINIPEENLFSLNGQIVELKKKPCAPVLSLDEEAKEQLLELAEEEEEAAELAIPRKISLGEIGYGPAKIKEPLFINVPPVAAPLDVAAPAGLVACNDGFQPGNVIIKDTPIKDQLVFPPPLPPPCPAELDLPPPPPPVLPLPALLPAPYSYLASSSASAAAAKQTTLFQSLGCS